MRKFVTLVALCALGSTSVAFAAAPHFPTKARSYATWMVRAYDSCTPGILSAVGVAAPGCLASVSDEVPPTDPLGATMNFSRLVVRRFPAKAGAQGRIKVTGRGFQPGQRIKVRLTLRTTRDGLVTKHPPAANQTVTFADTTIDCGVGSMNCFVARPNGALAGSQLLSDCLTQNGQPTGLAQDNVEIVNSSLVNCDTGNTVAVPGILN